MMKSPLSLEDAMRRLRICAAVVAFISSMVAGALAQEHVAVIPATADTVVLSGAWGSELQQAYGTSPVLPVVTGAERGSEVLLRFPLSALQAAPDLTIARARLELSLVAQDPASAPVRLEVLPVAPENGGWDERSLTSKDWETRRSARTRAAEKPCGSATILAADRYPTSCAISLRPSVVVSRLRGRRSDAVFSVRAATDGTTRGVYLASREAQRGQYAPRLLVWYEGDYVPDLDPGFSPWNSSESHALFAEIRAVGDAPAGAIESAPGGLRLRLFWRDDPRTGDRAGMIELPAPPFDTRTFRVSFAQEIERVRGPVRVSLLFSSPAGERWVWRESLGQVTTGPVRVELTEKDFRRLPSPFGETDAPPVMTAPVAAWAFESESTGSLADVAISDFTLTAPDAKGAWAGWPVLSAPSPFVATRRYGQDGAATTSPLATLLPPVDPRVIVTFAGDQLATVEGHYALYGLAKSAPLFEASFADVWEAQISRLAARLGKIKTRWLPAKQALSFQASVAALTAGEIARRSAWTVFEDGESLNRRRTWFPDEDRLSQASLLAPGTARAVAALFEGAADAGIADLALNDPAWPRRSRGEQAAMGGYGDGEIAVLRGFLSGKQSETTAGFWEYFRERAGFRPSPEWFGYRNWEEFTPVFERDERPNAGFQRRRRLLTFALARYGWLRFVDDTSQQVKRVAPGTRFTVCASDNDPLSAADAVSALALEGVGGILIRRTLEAGVQTFDDLYHAWPPLHEFAWRQDKRLGLAIRPSAEAPPPSAVQNGPSAVLQAYVAAYGWRAAARLDDLRLDEFNSYALFPVRAGAPPIENPEAAIANDSPILALARGFADAVEDNARPASPREILLIGEDAASDGGDPFERSRSIPRFAPLLCDLNVEFDAVPAVSPLLGVGRTEKTGSVKFLDRYRVIFLNAPYLPPDLGQRLAEWLRGASERRLVTLPATPTRVLNGTALWAAALEADPTALAEPDAAALGLKRIRFLTRLDAILATGQGAPRFTARVKPGTLLTPADYRLYDYEGERDVLLALDDGAPLLSETHPPEGGGRIVYFHYNAGLSAPAQIRFDRQIMASLVEELGLAQTAVAGEGVSVQAFAIDAGQKEAGRVFVLRPRPDPASLSNAERSEKAGTRVVLPYSDGAEAAVYWFVSGKRENVKAQEGRLGLIYDGQSAEIVTVTSPEEAERLFPELAERRSRVVRPGPRGEKLDKGTEP